MCLYYVEHTTKALRERFDNLPEGQDTLDFWKVYDVGGNFLLSPFFDQKIRKAGTIISNRKNKRVKKLVNWITEINKGIHVFTAADFAKDSIPYGDSCKVIVKVQAKKKDLIAAGARDAVFMKITISKEEWDKVFKKL